MTQPSKNGENAVDMLAVARIAQGAWTSRASPAPMPSSWWHRRK